MQNQATAPTVGSNDRNGRPRESKIRSRSREAALKRALYKRATGVPTYNIPEAAALLSVSPEHLYRLVRASAFPARPVGRGRVRPRYIVPAWAVERVLDECLADDATNAKLWAGEVPASLATGDQL